MAFLVDLLFLFGDIEASEEIESNHRVNVHNDGQEHHGENQLLAIVSDGLQDDSQSSHAKSYVQEMSRKEEVIQIAQKWEQEVPKLVLEGLKTENPVKANDLWENICTQCHLRYQWWLLQLSRFGTANQFRRDCVNEIMFNELSSLVQKPTNPPVPNSMSFLLSDDGTLFHAQDVADGIEFELLAILLPNTLFHELVPIERRERSIKLKWYLNNPFLRKHFNLATWPRWQAYPNGPWCHRHQAVLPNRVHRIPTFEPLPFLAWR